MSKVKELGLNRKKHIDFKFKGVEYAVKKPTVRELIRMEDSNSDLSTGGVEIVGYVENIVDLFLPKVTFEDLFPCESEAEIKIGKDKLKFKDMSSKKILSIIGNQFKIDKDKNGKPIMKMNQEGVLDGLLEMSDKTFDDISFSTAKQLVEKVSEKFDVDSLMEVYTFFQEKLQG